MYRNWPLYIHIIAHLFGVSADAMKFSSFFRYSNVCLNTLEFLSPVLPLAAHRKATEIPLKKATHSSEKCQRKFADFSTLRYIHVLMNYFNLLEFIENIILFSKFE